jgi:uncharacterized protein (TIGR00251 family)
VAISHHKDYIRAHRDGTLIDLKVKPGSSLRKLQYTDNAGLLISVNSPPARGKANKEMIKVLAEKLALPPSSLEITSGYKSRHKTILAYGIDVGEVRTRLSSP